jgi:hypothetical protein
MFVVEKTEDLDFPVIVALPHEIGIQPKQMRNDSRRYRWNQNGKLNLSQG